MAQVNNELLCCSFCRQSFSRKSNRWPQLKLPLFGSMSLAGIRNHSHSNHRTVAVDGGSFCRLPAYNQSQQHSTGVSKCALFYRLQSPLVPHSCPCDYIVAFVSVALRHANPCAGRIVSIPQDIKHSQKS